MPTDFTIKRTRLDRANGKRPTSTRFIVTRKSEDGGRESFWQLSPTAMRLLADRLQDALDDYEEQENHAGTRPQVPLA